MPETPPPSPDPETAARLFEQGLAADSAGAGDRRPPPPSPEAIQPHFPDLEIEAVIGEGGMGVVYRARHPRLDRRVALKILAERLGTDPAFAERFGREARTLARLDHPHIVRVYDFGERDGLYYLMMEYVDGANLRDVLREGRMPPEEALGIVPQICDALQFAHDGGVIHRDIKPENILIDAQGQAKITDFGLAKLLENERGDLTLTGTGQVMGTVQYMAPEQYRTPQQVDHRADIFSLGVVFYEMLTGELPVGHFRPPSHGQDIDGRIDEIVLKALERERDLRYQRAGEVSSDVHGLHDAPPPVTGEPASPRSSKVRLVLAALAIPLGLLAFALVHGAWGSVERGTPDAFQRELFKGLAAVAFFGVGALLAGQVAMLTRRGKGRPGVSRAALTLAIANFVAVPAVLVASAVEIQTHAISDAPRGVSIGLREDGTAEQETDEALVTVAEGLVGRLAAALRDRSDGLDLEEAMPLYDSASEAEISQLSSDERARLRAADRLGLPLVLPAKLEGPLGEFGVQSVRRGPGREVATVTLQRRGGGFFTILKLPIRYGSRWVTTSSGSVATGLYGWYFASGPVEIGHLDRPDER